MILKVSFFETQIKLLPLESFSSSYPTTSRHIDDRVMVDSIVMGHRLNEMDEEDDEELKEDPLPAARQGSAGSAWGVNLFL